MQCHNCKKEISDDSLFCKFCGSQVINHNNDYYKDDNEILVTADEGVSQNESDVKNVQSKRPNKILNLYLLLACVLLYIVISYVLIPFFRYQSANNLLNAGEYEKAKSIFRELGDYKDSAIMINECTYNEALALMKNKKYLEAIKIFNSISNYKDSKNLITECNYQNAVMLMGQKDYMEANDIEERKIAT